MMLLSRPALSLGVLLLINLEFLGSVLADDSVSQSKNGSQTQGGNDADSSNNPLTPQPTVFIENYGIPSLYGQPGQSSDQLFIRGAVPFKLFDEQQLSRFTVPVLSNPTTPSGSSTGIGDVQFINVTLEAVPGFGGVGIGPLLSFPTASSKVLGTGKWEAGAAAIAIAPRSWGLAGGLVTYQHSFASEQKGRSTSNLLTVEPIVTYNLPHGYYLRSSAIATFDFTSNTDVFPIGFGFGKVWKVKRTTINLYFEPQYSVWHQGNGLDAPRLQLLGGLTLQF